MNVTSNLAYLIIKLKFNYTLCVPNAVNVQHTHFNIPGRFETIAASILMMDPSLAVYDMS